MKRENWLEINDYIYRSINLDSDEKIIISVILSFTKDGKKFYMSQRGFSATYGMPVATVSRKFISLKKDGIISETENGLGINMKELEFRLNIVKKIKKTRKGGPGRKKKDNHHDYNECNHHDTDCNHHDTPCNHHDYNECNHHDTQCNHHDTKKNHSDYGLLKDNNKELPKENTKDTTIDINSDLGVSEETPKSNPIDDSFIDDMDLTEKFNYKPTLIEEPKQEITEKELDEFLKELDI